MSGRKEENRGVLGGNRNPVLAEPRRSTRPPPGGSGTASCRPRPATAACRSPSSVGCKAKSAAGEAGVGVGGAGGAALTCSSPPGRAAALRAWGGGRAATAAPWPAAAAPPTGRAWPAAGAPLTWVAADLRGAPGGTEYLDRAHTHTHTHRHTQMPRSARGQTISGGGGPGRVPTEDWVAQHLVLVRGLAQQGVGDGAVGVREAGQVRSGC